MNNGLNNRMNNSVNTNNNINNINNIYLSLLNKYKQNFPRTFNEKIQRIAEIKNSLDYQRLSIEEQDKLFLELTAYKGG